MGWVCLIICRYECMDEQFWKLLTRRNRWKKKQLPFDQAAILHKTGKWLNLNKMLEFIMHLSREGMSYRTHPSIKKLTSCQTVWKCRLNFPCGFALCITMKQIFFYFLLSIISANRSPDSSTGHTHWECWSKRKYSSVFIIWINSKLL